MKCPNCKETNLVIAERKGIEIDHCPECRGVWLDRGELDKIIEKSNLEEYNYRKENHSNHIQTDYYQKPYKRKKSFLEDIFD